MRQHRYFSTLIRGMPDICILYVIRGMACCISYVIRGVACVSIDILVP
jgi:hypothetical protein